VTPDVDRNTFTGALPNPAILPLVVRVAVAPDMILLTVGVPIKCAAAKTRDGLAIMANANNAEAAVTVIA